ncbi:snaclec coagulation factor IX/factor X-binding protein subunit A-like isoform X1 [Poecilia formosa]|uniref:snaclec coagulation factor IX/factor X-binding protein subunit A-like isoform X1 n=1 Tax=Poecilia formosa TaxID=48698 RepID=UPI0004438F83|nr:PREDICTED: snaclec coagulation factor IX/factor X-binding protein subunit A-like isoform X1 [Poecilia formosa]
MMNGALDFHNIHKPPKGEEESDSRFGSLCLGIVSALLTASIIIIIRMSGVLYRQEVNLSEMKMKMEILENRAEILLRDRNDLNWMLGVILTFDLFPVRDFCRENTGCQPCRRGWTLFQHRCYLFHEDGWFTWQEARQLCQDRHADLVVIDNLEEPEFISNRTDFYFDKNHGYWLGLNQTGSSWVWVDGRVDTLGFWMQKPFSFPGKNALLVPNRNPTTSWAKADSEFKNRFICEGKALTRS